MRDDRQSLEASTTSQHKTRVGHTLGQGIRDTWAAYYTDTWFSPLGDRNHAPTHMAAMMNRPMKMLHLEGQRQHMETTLSSPRAYA